MRALAKPTVRNTSVAAAIIARRVAAVFVTLGDLYRFGRGFRLSMMH
jgi:hypothetical protein